MNLHKKHLSINMELNYGSGWYFYRSYAMNKYEVAYTIRLRKYRSDWNSRLVDGGFFTSGYWSCLHFAMGDEVFPTGLSRSEGLVNFRGDTVPEEFDD